MKNVIGGAIGCAILVGGIYAVSVLRHDAELERIIAHLTADSRVAQAIVLDQWKEDGQDYTKVRFVPFDREGQPLRPRIFTVAGKTVYFDALVIKFDHELVKYGEGLKGKSLHLFRRAFGEYQAPDQGFELEGPRNGDGIPDAFRTSDAPSALEQSLWRDFWKLAEDPEAAEEIGVRVVQGEAPYTRMKPRMIYDIRLQNDAGLNIVPKDWPAAIPWPPIDG